MAFLRIFRLSNFSDSVFSFNSKRACFSGVFTSVNKPRIKVSYNMRTAYVHHNEGDEKVFISLHFCDLNVDKVLNFERNLFENLAVFLKRLDEKLSAACTRKLLRQKRDLVHDFPEFNTSMLLNNERVSDDLKFQDLFDSNFNGDLKIRILDNDYDVIVNAPIVKKVTLPKVLSVGSYIYPEKFEADCTDVTQSDFTWWRSETPTKLKTWEKCGEGYQYRINENDEDYYIKLLCTPKFKGRVGPTIEVMSGTAVKKHANFNEVRKRLEFTKEKTDINEFRIVSYNILADLYVNTKEAKTEIFTFCDPSYLDYEYRKTLLNFELRGFNADIVCLQEAERKFMNNPLLFTTWGYESIYHEKEGTREGCGLLYNSNKFHLISSNQYNFTNEILSNPLFSDIRSKIESNVKLFGRLLNIYSQIQVTVLECVSDNVLIVGNVHLYFHPDADHIRLLQGIISLKILIHAVDEIKEKEPNKKVSVVLCGDFNSTPDCGFHQLLNEGSIDSNHKCWKSKEEELIKDVSCSHQLKMKSCYDYSILTNFIPTFKACIDYIYFQCDHLELKQTVPVPSEEVLSKNSGIPSQFFPSDHVALIADFKFKNEN